MPLTTSFANQLLDLVTCNRESVGSNEVWLGLSSQDPGASGAGFTEPSAEAGYERVLLGAKDQTYTKKMNAASGKLSTNKEQITFNKAITSWGTLSYAGLFSSKTGTAESSLMWYGALSTPITPTAGHVALILANDLQLSIDFTDQT